MRGTIYWVIPKEEDKIFQQGEIWHRKIWLTKKKYVELFKQFQTKVKEQKDFYNEKKKNWERVKGEMFEILKGRLEVEPEKRNQHLWLWNNFSYKNYQTYLNNGNSPFSQNKDEPDDMPLNEYWEWWEKLNAKHEIYLSKQTREIIVFNYHTPNNIIVSIYDYLFNYQGIWYEVVNHERKAWNVLTITAEYSIYWNDYWYCLNANANGVIHNLPSEIIGEEVCMCPSFNENESTVFSTFTVDYELKFSMWLNQAKNNKWRSDFALASSNDPDFPWLRIGPWERQNQPLNNRKLGELIERNVTFLTITSAHLKDWWGTGINFLDKLPARAYADDTNGSKISLPNWIERVLPNKNYFHCYANHIQASLCWRERVIWRGNFYFLRELKIKETSNLSGIEVSFHVGSQQIASIKESIFIKAGSDQEGALSLIMNTIVSTATAAVAGYVKGGSAGAATGAALSLFGTAMGNGAQAINGLNQTQIFSQEYTVDEFFHKYIRTGLKPVQLTLEINDELNNRYLANKVIKQGGEVNQYFNVANFGALMDSDGYRKFHFHTLNMKGLNGGNSSQEWFLEQLERGVQLVGSGENLIEWYQLELPRNRTQGLGSSCPGSLDIMEVKNKKTILDTFDPSKAIASYTTYFRVPSDSLYREMAIGKFSSHHNGPTGTPNETGNTKFSDGKNMVCWGCGLDQSQPHFLKITNGGMIYTYFDSNASGETPITVPDNCTLIVDAPAGNIRIEETETVRRHIPGEPPEGFDKPAPTYIPSGSGMPEDAFDPSIEPDINFPEPDLIDPGGGGEPEIPVDPDITPEPDPTPDIDPTPDPDPSNDPEPDKPEPDPGDGETEKPEDFD